MNSVMEVVASRAQEAVSECPVIILGSGASAAFGIPGMPGLRQRILDAELPPALNGSSAKIWNKFIEILSKADLETALNDERLPEELTAFVVEQTWDYLAPYDYSVFESFLSNRKLFPLTRLFQHLLSSTRKEIHVVTPNYDRLAEYAAEAGALCHFTGFSYGHLRGRTGNGQCRIYAGTKPARTVNIWKVHGSFDWFTDADGVVVGLPLLKQRPPKLTPVIVTPGVEKYRLTHGEPFHSIKGEADRALQNADAYFCVGYGFNDTHLQTVLVERCRSRKVPLVLLSKEISPTAKAFIESGKCGHYLAIEECGDGCKVFSSDFPGGQVIPGERLWMLNEFLSLIMP